MASLTASVTRRPTRAATVSLAVLAVLVLAWFAAARHWHESWHDGGLAGAAANFLPPLAFILLAQLNEWRLQARKRPAAFEVTDGAFVAPAATQVAAAGAASTLALATVIATLYLFPRPTDWPTGEVLVGRIVMAGVVAVFLLKVAALARRSGRIELRPEGLRVSSVTGVRDVSWEAVTARPYVPPTGKAWVQRAFLERTVNHYLINPAARAGIGTADGYDTLRRTLEAT